MTTELHPLLKRQMEKEGITGDLSDPLAQFWERISRAYTEADQDRYRLERSLTVALEEMEEEIAVRKRAESALAEKNQQLRRAVDLFHSTIEHLIITMEHGAPRQELLDYMQMVQVEFEKVSSGL
jgi:threonyl-tRNA synthetase